MMYVPDELQIKSKDELHYEISGTIEEDISPVLLIKIDYCYHNKHDTYDDGLSFLDRINAKIGRFHPNWSWNIVNMKERIRLSANPTLEYVSVISEMFSRDGMIAFYGI